MDRQQSPWQWPSEALALWHALRLPLVAAAVLLLVAFRVSTRRKTASPPDLLPEKAHADQYPTVAPKAVIPKPTGPRTVKGTRPPKIAKKPSSTYDHTRDSVQPLVFFSSLAGTTEAAAKGFVESLAQWNPSTKLLKPQLHDLAYIDYDDFFISPPKSSDTKYFYLVIIPTFNIDTVLDTFLEHLKETHHDFRIDTAPLSTLLGYSVFGFGDKEGWPTEEEGFCSQAKEADKWLAKLTGRKRAFPLGMGDVKSDAKIRLEEWKEGIKEVIVELLAGNGLGEGVPESGAPVESDEEDADYDEEQSRPKKSTAARVDDVEDLGRMISKPSKTSKSKSSAPLAIDFTTPASTLAVHNASPAVKEMVPNASPTYAALTKQGYTIVGSHSGVKLCRWTKSALRGRGSCYKFSFYGIASHQCMETTPSLSCSNKCVFCWRHGTNPVGTTWRWKVDPPDEIFKGVVEGHYKKIKMMKGVPGVRAERFAEGMRIRHCALSLVGEPIFYPHINEFTALLHQEHISTFLVCNAQHPDQLQALKPVTQLYVSIDASNKESLRRIDRPLHRDYWERFTRCLDILREKRFQQRTVFRLTLVKGFNIEDEAEGYAELVARGLPCFVEVKGVTYCGTSTSSSAGLTMQNVPFYHEVVAFVEALTAALNARGLGYGIAVEHAHSCCILIASERFRINGRWHTLIDYAKFFQCLESGKEFAPEDYIGEPSPEWALFGNGGFDPRDQRVDRKGRVKEVA